MQPTNVAAERRKTMSVIGSIAIVDVLASKSRASLTSMGSESIFQTAGKSICEPHALCRPQFPSAAQINQLAPYEALMSLPAQAFLHASIAQRRYTTSNLLNLHHGRCEGQEHWQQPSS